ncbi:universal stress protein [Cellulomonas xylanilytica]|uniref:UspA domain-containing protein n=1 Tax=Cellulomonas xylanilytica TaxID=233583 RepID=A0A510V9Q5_9CELL|nr:universal stress protein [Cellulomonas xylanilytica]GEK23476.1 hypothetical protein CXY01_39960 [Cellulomonas xylanilytica]
MTRSAPHPWHGVVEPGAPTLVVGVLPNQPPTVVRRAASLAHAMRASLVCVWADPARSLVGEEPDGTLVTTPLDPDHVDSRERDGVAETALGEQLATDLGDVDVPWRFVYTVGEASRALARVARETGALQIVLGSRRPGIGGWMNHLIGGSTAGRLAHTQPVPVTIVPLCVEDHP